MSSFTVCFISTVTFHDGVTKKIIKIIQFCKKSLKDNTLAFVINNSEDFLKKYQPLNTLRAGKYAMQKRVILLCCE